MTPEVLETVFGGESSSGFGSAVFRRASGDPVEHFAREVYRSFVGESWDRFGEAAWLGPWLQVLSSPQIGGIVSSLRAIQDPAARSSAEVFLEACSDPTAAEAALTSTFDDPAASERAVFRIGDGAALSGILLAARTSEDGLVAVVFLMD